MAFLLDSRVRAVKRARSRQLRCQDPRTAQTCHVRNAAMAVTRVPVSNVVLPFNRQVADSNRAPADRSGGAPLESPVSCGKVRQEERSLLRRAEVVR